MKRVRFYPDDIDEVFEGQVIEESNHFYLVVPDQNLALRQRWAKSKCKVIFDTAQEITEHERGAESTCFHPCTPSDWKPGGKCDKMGCYHE